MPNVHEIIRDHVSLSITCVDRLYVNGYLPTLQTGGQLRHFMHDHLGQPIPSPALLRPLHNRFVKCVEDVAQRNRTPISSPASDRATGTPTPSSSTSRASKSG
jgi:hypothetical protein